METINTKKDNFWGVRNRIYSYFLEKFIPYRELIEEIIKNLKFIKNAYILDAGCGSGIFEKMINQKNLFNLKIEAIDISLNIIEILRKKNKFFKNINFSIANLNKKLKYKDETFDAIVCINVFYLLHQPKNTLLEFHRILKKGGRLIITTPKPNFNYFLLFKEHFKKTKGLRKLRDIILFPFILSLILPFEFIITHREKCGYYHRFTKDNLIKLFEGTNFKFSISNCYFNQNFLIIAEK